MGASRVQGDFCCSVTRSPNLLWEEGAGGSAQLFRLTIFPGKFQELVQAWVMVGAGLCLFLRGPHLPNDQRTLQSGAQGRAGLALQEHVASGGTGRARDGRLRAPFLLPG